jgi:hypothetical protein
VEDGEILGEAVQWMPRASQVQRAHPLQHRPKLADAVRPLVAADHVGGMQIGHPVQEGSDVGPPQRRRIHSLIGSLQVQTLRQHLKASQVASDGSGALLAPALRKGIVGPDLGCLAQPSLTYLSEP